ncbi:MAG: hypothetical protein JSU94_19565 [Phycisphaerales bacterium]|nr:MAG: hypothetical protein JSU94_19565 [Phycisphaerales bacterium]
MAGELRFSLFVWLVTVVLSSCGYGDTDPNLVGWWRFDDASGIIAENSAGSANGTLVGDPVWTTGVLGGALEFDGDGDYVYVSMRNASFGSASIGLWIKTDTGQLGVMALDGSERFHIEVTAEGYLAVDVNGVDIVNHKNVADRKWHHIAIVRELDTPEHELAIYIDGDKGATSAAEQRPFALSQIIIGWHNIRGGNSFDGLIDDVRMYNVALTQTQIDNLARCAILPSPQDGEIGVSGDAQLTWTPGNGVLSHDIYFDTESPPTTLIGDDITLASIDPGPLKYGVTYYWRVDENIIGETITGYEWSFKTAPWAGSGDANDPFHICDVADLATLCEQYEHWGDCFILTADIHIPPGVDIDPIGWHSRPFNNIFDGGGHVISGLTWGAPGISNHYTTIGLFGKTGPAAQIRNLGVVDARIDCGSLSWSGFLVVENGGSITHCYSTGGISTTKLIMSASERVGGLVGVNRGTISDCYSSAEISGGRTQAYAFGGLVGRNEGVISDCYSVGDVTGCTTTNWGAMSNGIGGLVGMNFGDIGDCYASGDVYALGEAVGNVGGLAGRNDGMVTHCYSRGEVYAAGQMRNYIGGLVGGGVGAVTDSFWDIETSGQTESAGGRGRKTAEMMKRATFGWSWDFGGLWRIAEDRTYPHLRIEPPTVGDLDGDGDVDFDDFSRMAENWMVGD